MASLNLYLLTFNCARNLISPTTFAPHFFDALPRNETLPDIVVISLQEIAPIALSFLGGQHLIPYYDRVVLTLESAIEQHGGDPSIFRHILTRHVGLTALMIFARHPIADQIRWTQTGQTGVGLWDMANKGAVGARLGYALKSDGDELLELIFVAAHLAPFEDQAQRRNRDWEAIVRTLVFTEPKQKAVSSAFDQAFADTAEGNEEDEPFISYAGNANHFEDEFSGLYNSSAYTFVAGDLNYRTRHTRPGPNDWHTYPKPGSPTSPYHYSHFLRNDQLIEELHAGRTLHGFQELPINFPPTYKYSFNRPKPNSPRDIAAAREGQAEDWPWAKHRVPSWCDRILFLGPPSSSAQLKPRVYSSLALQPTSDHQPVALSVSVPLSQPLAEIAPQDDIRGSPPFAIDKRWRDRRLAAKRKELVVGGLSYLALTGEGQTILVAVGLGIVMAYFVLSTWLQ